MRHRSFVPYLMAVAAIFGAGTLNAVNNPKSASAAISAPSLVPVLDSACLTYWGVQLDTLAKVHLATTKLTAYQKRARARLDSLMLNVVCTDSVPPDTTPPDSTPPDTTPPATVTDTTPVAGVAMPAVFLNFPYPTATRTYTVTSNLQTALDTAKRGDELRLSGTFTGNYTVSSCASGWIVVRTLGSHVPALGTRITPTDAASSAKVITATSQPAIKATSAACGWRFVGLDIGLSASVSTAPNPHYGVMILERGAKRIVLDRVYLHGTATDSLIRTLAMHSDSTQVSDSWLSDAHAVGYDAQAIWGGEGNGPYKIINNHLEASGENVLFGGNAPSVLGTVPSDIEVRGNYFLKPAAWRTNAPWLEKNLFELKNARRVLVTHNIFDGSWPDGQSGHAMIFMSSNQGGNCRLCRVTDVTFRRNKIINVGAGPTVSPHGDLTNGLVGVDTLTRRIAFVMNVIDVGTYAGDKRGFTILSGVTTTVIDSNVISGTIGGGSWYHEGGTPCTIRANTVKRGQYFWIFKSGSGEGTATLSAACPVLTFTNNVLVGAANGSTYPATTTVVASEGALAVLVRAKVDTATTGVIRTP